MSHIYIIMIIFHEVLALWALIKKGVVEPSGSGEGPNMKITSAIDSEVQKTTSSMPYIDIIMIRTIHEVLAAWEPNKKRAWSVQKGRGKVKTEK